MEMLVHLIVFAECSKWTVKSSSRVNFSKLKFNERQLTFPQSLFHQLFEKTD